MPTDTRKKLLHAALWRFYRDGFRNVGLDQILAEVGISKTAFYKHFESKDDLMTAVLDDHTAHMTAQLREAAARCGSDDPAARLRAVFDVVEHYAGMDGFKGCVFVNASIEFPLPHDPAHQAARRNKEAIEGVVRDLAAEAGAADPTGLARELCMIMEGAYVTRHVTGRIDAAAVARKIGDVVIDAYLRKGKRRAAAG
jgi:AcrR family transcriptional regulator